MKLRPLPLRYALVTLAARARQSSREYAHATAVLRTKTVDKTVDPDWREACVIVGAPARDAAVFTVCDKDVGICTNRRYGYDCSCPDDYTCKAGPNGPREPRNPATMFGRSERREKACFRRYV